MKIYISKIRIVTVSVWLLSMPFVSTVWLLTIPIWLLISFGQRILGSSADSYKDTIDNLSYLIGGKGR